MATKETAMERARERVEEGLERAQDTMQGLDRRARSFISERPVTALLLAVGVGYLVGRLVARR